MSDKGICRKASGTPGLLHVEMGCKAFSDYYKTPYARKNNLGIEKPG